VEAGQTSIFREFLWLYSVKLCVKERKTTWDEVSTLRRCGCLLLAHSGCVAVVAVVAVAVAALPIVAVAVLLLL
jgi:hypothetical protein